MAKCYAGFRGEQSVAYHLTFVEGRHEILHDVRLPYQESTFFQMDYLLLLPFFILLIEVKNIVGTSVFDRTFHHLPFKITDLQKKFSQELLTKNELRKVARLLVKQHVDANYDVLSRFQIDRSEILTGILCPACNSLLVQKQRERWDCIVCATSSKYAHIQALLDYRLLIESTITNKQLRSFLQISSVSVASKILSSLNTTSSGTFKNRVYHLSIAELQRIIRNGK